MALAPRIDVGAGAAFGYISPFQYTTQIYTAEAKDVRFAVQLYNGAEIEQLPSEFGRKPTSARTSTSLGLRKLALANAWQQKTSTSTDSTHNEQHSALKQAKMAPSSLRAMPTARLGGTVLVETEQDQSTKDDSPDYTIQQPLPLHASSASKAAVRRAKSSGCTARPSTLRQQVFVTPYRANTTSSINGRSFKNRKKRRSFLYCLWRLRRLLPCFLGLLPAVSKARPIEAANKIARSNSVSSDDGIYVDASIDGGWTGSAAYVSMKVDAPSTTIGAAAVYGRQEGRDVEKGPQPPPYESARPSRRALVAGDDYNDPNGGQDSDPQRFTRHQKVSMIIWSIILAAPLILEILWRIFTYRRSSHASVGISHTSSHLVIVPPPTLTPLRPTAHVSASGDFCIHKHCSSLAHHGPMPNIQGPQPYTIVAAPVHGLHFLTRGNVRAFILCVLYMLSGAVFGIVASIRSISNEVAAAQIGVYAVLSGALGAIAGLLPTLGTLLS